MEGNYNGLMAILYGVVFLRGMAFLRIFDNLRYLISMILEILKDMRSFLIVLIYWIIALTLIFDTLATKDTDYDALNFF